MDIDLREDDEEYESEEPSGTHMNFPAIKWKRLKSYYNDKYLDVFRDTYTTDARNYNPPQFKASQLGASIWTAEEKIQFFTALASHGRHDLPAISQRVESKSEIEVKHYLDLLKKEELDRQLFERQTKNISHAEIPAGIEIGPEMEAQLNGAADALAAFQEQYDYAVGQQDNSGPWIIGPDDAARYDEQAESTQDSEDEKHESRDEIIQPPRHARFFHLSNLLELSERLFMNGSQQAPEYHWRTLAEPGERPSMTQEALRDFYEIVVGLVQRVVQTGMFLCQSRIKATDTTHHKPTYKVKREDVAAAVDILNMKHDMWDYWTTLPRRHGINVVAGSHQKGQSDKHYLSYQDVEGALSVRRHSGRRRSLSITSNVSNSSESESRSAGEPPYPESDDQSDQDMQGVRRLSSPYESGARASTASEDSQMQNDDHLRSFDGTDRPNAPMSRSKRKRLAEEEYDEYLEELDQRSRRAEEQSLRVIFDADANTEIKEEAEEEVLGRRPKVPRKTVDEVEIWRGSYKAPWESSRSYRNFGTEHHDD